MATYDEGVDYGWGPVSRFRHYLHAWEGFYALWSTDGFELACNFVLGNTIRLLR